MILIYSNLHLFKMPLNELMFFILSVKYAKSVDNKHN